MWAALLSKLPFLSKVGKFLGSGKFLIFLGAVIVSLFIITQGISFIGKYVDREVKTGTELILSKQEVEGLKYQIKTLKENQQVNTQVIKETRVIQEKQQEKAAKIEDKINEQVQNGNDGYSGGIVESVIDSL